MSIVVTGATGNLGGLSVDALLRRGVEPSELVAAGRNPERLAAQGAKGVRTARFDLDDPGTLAAAFRGAEKVFLGSIPGNPRRVEQHGNAIDAARAAGVGLLVYSSFLKCDINSDHPDHHATEQLLAESGVPHVVLRTGVYFSFFTRQIPVWLEQGEVIGTAGEGRISAVARSDVAAAAACVLTTAGHAGARYDLGIDDSFTWPDVAAELGRQTGASIPYVRIPADELEARLVAQGQPEPVARRRVVTDLAIDEGLYVTDSGDLRRLVGRPPVGLSETIAQALG